MRHTQSMVRYGHALFNVPYGTHPIQTNALFNVPYGTHPIQTNALFNYPMGWMEWPLHFSMYPMAHTKLACCPTTQIHEDTIQTPHGYRGYSKDTT